MSDAFEEFGPYLVYERLGQGGMATVHRAEKRGVGIRRPIALKRLLPHVADDPEIVQLFVDEARLASQLRHANVAQTYELGKVGDVFFMAMEYASGPTLTQIVRQCQNAAGDIPLPITVNILTQICDALDYAHNLCDEAGNALRIIHRDVSPANIIVTNAGIVKLIDFGIAKATISSVKTQTGFIKGKFGYIAPEYLSGKIDARVDLFAAGVVAHELLAGRRLFEGKDDFETMANIRGMQIQPPSRWNAQVTPDLDDIVMTALQRDPDARWQSAAAMRVALANVARSLGVVVGNHQLLEWVDWAFSQVLRESGPARAANETDTGTDTGALRAGAQGNDSNLSIRLSFDIGDAATPVPELSDADSDSAQTLLREPQREPDAGEPAALPPEPALVLPRPSRPSRAYEAMPPPPLPVEAIAPPPSRSLGGVESPAVRGFEDLALPDARMFDEPARRNSPASAATPVHRLATAAARGDHRRVLWLILLMVGLGAGAMAVVYFWP